MQAAQHFLEPGHILVARRATTIAAVVANQVAVTCWDKQRLVGGMSLFPLPATSRRDQATPNYGNVATAALVNYLCEGGSRCRDLVAQVVGGAIPEDHPGMAGLSSENVRIAQVVLRRKKVRILSVDTGGALGRKIVFDTTSGELAILKVQRVRDADWYLGPWKPTMGAKAT